MLNPSNSWYGPLKHGASESGNAALQLRLPQTPLLEAFASYLIAKVDKGEMGLDSAKNYARVVRRFIDGVDASSEEAAALDKHLLGKPDQLIDRHLTRLKESGASPQNYNATRSVLFQFYAWANRCNWSNFDLAEVGYLAAQLSEFPMPSVMIEWSKYLKSTESSTKMANQLTLLVRPFIKFVAQSIYPPDGKEMNLKGEWTALRNIQRRADVQHPAARPASSDQINTEPRTVTGQILLNGALWSARYLEHLKTDGASGDKMKRSAYAMRKFYQWSNQERISAVNPGDIVNPGAAASKNAAPRLKSSPRDGAAKSTSTTPRAVLAERGQSGSLNTETVEDHGSKSTLRSLAQAERKNHLLLDRTITELLRDGRLTLSELRSLRHSSVSIDTLSIKLPERIVPLESENNALLLYLRLIERFAAGPESARDSRLFEGIFTEEAYKATDKNAAAFIALRDQILSDLLTVGQLSFKDACTVPFPAVSIKGGTISLLLQERKIEISETAAIKRFNSYMQLGRIYLPNSPFSTAINPVTFLLTIDSEPLCEIEWDG